MKSLNRFAGSTISAYVMAGMAYSLTGYVERAALGKQTVFSPLIGIPMDIAGWPWMVYADLKHIGVMPRDVLALIAAVTCIALSVRKELLLRRSMD